MEESGTGKRTASAKDSSCAVSLRGLTADEVQRMIGAIASRDVPWSMAEAVHHQTEGNPLFIQEVLRYLVEEGLVDPDQEGA